MYAKYKYLPGATAANIISDICKLVSGVTNIATLSASCDQTLTFVDARYKPGGWELFDADAPIAGFSNGHVIRAPHADDPTSYKYLYVSTDDDKTPTSKISVSAMEDWDDVNDVAVNHTTMGLSSIHIDYDSANGGNIHIYATDRVCFFYAVTTTYPLGGQSDRWVLAAEMTRMDYDNVAGASPSYCVGVVSWYSQGSEQMLMPRLGGMVKPYLRMGTINGIRVAAFTTNPNLQANPNEAGRVTYLLHPLMFSGMQSGPSAPYPAFGGSASELESVWLTRLTAVIGDQVVINGTDTYVCFPLSGASYGTTLLCRVA